MGSDQARERTAGLFANLTTKILHANGDPTTNKWGAEQIGRVLQYRTTVNGSSAPPARNVTLSGILEMFRGEKRTSVSMNQIVDYEVQPSEFTKLRIGGEKNGRLVDAYLVKPGAAFACGKHYFRATFEQENPNE